MGNLVPFVGAGASRIAGCPNWSEFADGILRQFVDQGKITHSELAQIGHLGPRMKLSIALGMRKQYDVPIDFKKVLYPSGVKDSLLGHRLYESLYKLGKTSVTTNYDNWLDAGPEVAAPALQANADAAQKTPTAVARNVVYEVSKFSSDLLSDPNNVIHLHGHADKPDGMILTTQHYVDHYANDRGATGTDENKVLTFLSFLFQQKNVLFVGYGLDELEILEYAITKGTMGTSGKEIRHYLLQGFFSHEAALGRNLMAYYAEFGIELIPFSRDYLDWNQLVEVLEEFARLSPAQNILPAQTMMDMKAMLKK